MRKEEGKKDLGTYIVEQVTQNSEMTADLKKLEASIILHHLD